MIGTADGELYAVAVLTRLHRPFGDVPAIDQAMAFAVQMAIKELGSA